MPSSDMESASGFGHLHFLHRSNRAQRLIVLIVLICLMFTAVHPFLSGELPLTADGELHLYRLVSLDHAVKQGVWWPRYVPGMAFGYGAPFFNYYSPLSLYPLEGIHLLGASFLNAWLLGFIFYAVVGAAGAYLFGSAWMGQIGGMAAAVAYTYAPYTLYDSAWRGTVAEFAALALLPWVFWGFWRLAVYGRRRDLLAAVIAFALFIPMHNVITLHSAALLAVFCVYLWWISPHRRRVFIHLVLGFVLALGLTAFFWLPALAELDYVKINGITTNLPDIDVANNLRSLSDVFALPYTADPTQLQPPVSISLGWPQLLFGVAALILLARHTASEEDRRLRGWLWLSVLLIAGLVFMNTRASTAIWRSIAVIRYSQFPWRLIGPASLLLAIAAGAGVSLIAKRIAANRWKFAWLAACLTIMMVYAVPWLYRIYLPDPPANSIIDAQNFERETGWIATSSFGEYLPRWNQELPDPDRLVTRYAESDVISRLEPPPGVTIDSAQWGITNGKLTLTAQSETTLVFDWFYFPGWRATLDGENLPLAPTNPEGLISAAIPPGEHWLDIHLGLTSTQTLATIISVAAFLGLTGMLVLSPYPKTAVDSRPVVSILANWLFVTVAFVGIGVFAIKALVIDNSQTALKRERFASGVESGLQVMIAANFDNQVTLLGYDLSESQVKSGDRTRMNLYWQLKAEKIYEDYSSVIHLRDSAGHVIAETGSFYPGGLATSNWLPGYYVQERLEIRIPPGTPPGVYTIDVMLYRAADQHSLNVINAQGNPEDVKVSVGELTVSLSSKSPDPDVFKFGQQLDAELNGDLQLLGTGLIPASAEVGQEIALEWFIEALNQPEEDYRARILWLAADGEIAASSPDIPLATGYPTNQWRRGDIWRGIHAIYVPGRLESSSYTTAIQLIDEEGQRIGRQVVLGVMQVNTPPRIFTAPAMSNPANVTWANGISLIGYDLSEEDDSLSLTFYWQPRQDVLTGLRVFVHLVDDKGIIVAQSDRVPVNWGRPTTGWAVGEIIVDPVELTTRSLPPGQYSVFVGWYDPASSWRIPLLNEDFWTLPERITLGG